MRSVIVGAGPTGLYTAIALARRGHQVTVIDRDPGPDGGRWDRKGVMQFHHPHFFRQQVADALQAEMPEVWDGLLAAGAVPAILPGQPGVPAGLHCRRLTFERVLRTAAQAEPGVRLRTGHVDEVCSERGRVTGVRMGGRQVDAGLVIDAGGRGGRLTRALRRPAEGGDCGIAYVSRQYQMLPGATGGQVNMPFGVAMNYPGYLAAAFIHDNQVISVLIARASADRPLAALRTRVAFEAATRAIPVLAAWTGPGQARPLSPVLPGGRLYNSYRGQLDDAGRVALAGLIYAGDSVCTTNPSAGRGVTTSLLQARQLIALLAGHGRDLTSCSLAFDQWCASHIKPWFDDHVYWDADLIRRWSGQDVDLTRPLPPDLIMAAGQADPEIAKAAGPYQAMHALPGSLDAVQARARDLYATGWRPPTPLGPSRDELAALVTAAATSGSHPAEDAALSAAAAPAQLLRETREFGYQGSSNLATIGPRASDQAAVPPQDSAGLTSRCIRNRAGRSRISAARIAPDWAKPIGCGCMRAIGRVGAGGRDARCLRRVRAVRHPGGPGRICCVAKGGGVAFRAGADRRGGVTMQEPRAAGPAGPLLPDRPGRILVVDDDPAVTDVLRRYLVRDGHAVECVHDGDAALRRAAGEPPDLVVLDLVLPGMDGLEVCRRLRARWPVPVVMLTALGGETDRLAGFEAGADDYVTKPFSPRELALRVRSVLRRASARGQPGVLGSGVIADGDLVADLSAHEVRSGGELVQLTVREYGLLVFFMRNPRQAFTREQLLAAVWGWTSGDAPTVTVHVRRLREKLEPDPARPRRILTVWGVGYRYEPQAG